MARRWFSSLVIAFAAVSAAKGALTQAVKLDNCIQDFTSCIKVLDDEYALETKDFTLVRFVNTGDSIQRIQYKSLPDNSLESTAVVVSSLKAKLFKEKMTEIGIVLPHFYMDPICKEPASGDSAFYRDKYMGKDNTLCFGYSFENGEFWPLVLDEFILAHEMTHIFVNSEFAHDMTLQVSHDLDSFNEGFADYLAEYLTEGTFSSFFSKRVNLSWRQKENRDNSLIDRVYYADVYRDGQKWTRFLSVLDSPEKAVCAVKKLADNFRTRFDEAIENGVYDNRIITNNDIVDSFSDCEVSKDLLTRYFPNPVTIESEKSLEVSVFVINDSKTMCHLQKNHDVQAFQWQRKQLYNSCLGHTTFNRSGKPLLLPWEQEFEKLEPSYAFIGVNVVGYEKGKCTLKGYKINNQVNNEVQLPVPGEKLQNAASLLVPENMRGSFYADLPYNIDYKQHPSFLKDVEDIEKYSIFLREGDNTLPGYFFYSFVDSEKSLEDKKISKGKIIGKSFHQGIGCFPDGGCDKLKNFVFECEGLSDDIKIKKVDVFNVEFDSKIVVKLIETLTSDDVIK